jgi:hypothetical protein
MFVEINKHLIRVENIAVAYPCDGIGIKEDDSKTHTYILNAGSAKGFVYDVDYTELVKLIERSGNK